MNVQTKLLCTFLWLSASVPFAFAKQAPKLTFEKYSLSVTNTVTGKLLYVNDTEHDTDLLIQSDKGFVYYPQIVKNTLSTDGTLINIPKDARYYNIGRRANVEQDVLFYLTKDEIQSYDFTTQQLTSLFSIDSLSRYQQEFEAKLSPFILDVNGDELTDVITYSLDNTHLYLQQENGGFIHKVLPLSPKVTSSSQSVTFTPYPFFHIDINGDNRKDISFQVYGKLVSFLQQNNGSFNSEAHHTALNAGILSRLEYKKLKQDSKSEVAQVSIEGIEDLNNDGIVDLITKSRLKTGMISSDNELLIRYGSLNNGFLAFREKPDGKAVFEGEGDLVFKDINQDGLKDYYTRGVEIGFGMIMSAMSGSVDVDLNFYLMNDTGNYHKKPAFQSEMEVEISDDSDGFGLNAIEDFNGDGALDLIIQSDDDEFKIHHGGGKNVFAKRGTSYDITLPIKGHSEVKDFNGDGKADLLLLHGKKYDSEEKKELGKNQIVLWLSAG
ncbi:FG-GAP repeat domain-containing protein [Colwelliaceae bacterium 6441]